MTRSASKLIRACPTPLLAATALALAIGAWQPVFAQGGQGGQGGNSTGNYPGGAGGTVTSPVGQDASNPGSGGGGGGGPGGTGGAGATVGSDSGGNGGAGGANGHTGSGMPTGLASGEDGSDGGTGSGSGNTTGGGGGGGAGGYGAIVNSANPSEVNSNIISAGAGGRGGNGGSGNYSGSGGGGGDGGMGLVFTGHELANDAALTSGSGGDGGQGAIGGGANATGGDGGNGGNAGDGLAFDGDALTNHATVTAGNGGNAGEGGKVGFSSGTTSGGNGGNGGMGGTGISSSHGTLANTGDIIAGAGGTGGTGGAGGDGGPGTDGNGGNGGMGGTGVSLSNGTLANTGNIIAGSGGAGGVSGGSGTDGSIGAGGAGVEGSDLAITNAGTISGGLSGDGITRADSLAFTGGTNKLTLENGSNLIGNVSINGNGSLTFLQPTDQTLNNTITGNGSVIKTGGGVLTLNGVNTYTGGTTVNTGTLVIGDSNTPTARIEGDAQVNAGGTLRGHGTIGGNVTNNGIVWPGGSIGTLTIGGNYTQSSSGTLKIDVSPAAASQLKVGGAANLNGDLNILYGPGTYSAKTYKVVDAGTVNGQFSSVSGSTPPGIAQSASYGPNAAYLVLASKSPGKAPVVIAPENATVVGDMGSAVLRGGQQTNMTLLERLGNLCTSTTETGCIDPGKRLWLQANGTFTHVDGNHGAPDVRDDRYGFMMGTDRQFGSWTAGVAAGYSHNDLRESGGDATGKIDTARIALYGGRSLGAVNLSGTTSYAYDFTSTERDFPGFGETRDDSHAQEFTAALQASTPWKLHPALTLTPYLGLRYAYVHGLATSESGLASQQLEIDSQTQQSLQPYVGVTLDYAFTAGNTERLSHLRVRAGYAYETLSTNRDTTVSSSDGTQFVIPGTQDSRGMVTAGLGLDMPIGKATRAYVRYDAVLPTGNITAQSAQIGVNYQF